MHLANRKSEIANGKWLPDMDLNHDKQIQSLLCYRYTIGQAGASSRLKNFVSESRLGILINTGLQSGVSCARQTQNRFNGFFISAQTVETVKAFRRRRSLGDE